MAYQPNNWNPLDIITSEKLNDIEQGLTKVSEDTIFGAGGALQPSEGIHSLLYINKGDSMPSNPSAGDTVFVRDGDDYTVVEWDGAQWVTRLDPKLSERIDKVLEGAKTQSEQLISDNNNEIHNTIDEVTKEKIALALADADFNKQAQAMADKALSDAKANTATVAQETLDSANANIADAKKSVSDDIAKEASDRATAVSALDTKAQGYADTAKKNAIDVATSADGVINKKIDDTASSITSTVSQNKKDADGKISTAQSTATQALNGLSNKVDTYTYNAKTGQLSTDITNVTQTANQAKTDIASIKQTDTAQDARMTTIEADADGTKTTVSNLQKTQGKQSGDISTLQQRADGFDATVTKVNNLSTGDRNYILDTANPKTQTSNGKDSQDLYNSAVFYSPIKNWGIANGDYIISFDWVLKTALSSDMQASVFFNQSPWQAQNFTVKSGQLTGHVDLKFKLYPGILTASQDVLGLNFRIMSQMASGNTITYYNLFMKSGTIVTTWTPAPEDLSGATAKAQLTADQATTTINTYKTSNDGRVASAESKITQNANAITQKVSQTDYDKKTGELSTKVSTAQQTADNAVTTIGNYKTSNDNRVKATESKITANAEAITQKVSQTDYNQKTGELSGQISEVSQTAGKISQSVSDVKAQVDGLSVGGRNLFLGTKDFSGNSNWNISGDLVENVYQGLDAVQSNYAWGGPKYNNSALESQGVIQSVDDNFIMSAWVRNTGTSPTTIYIYGDFLSLENYKIVDLPANSGWVRINSKPFGFTKTSGLSGSIRFEPTTSSTGGNIQQVGLKLEKGNIATDWSPAPEDTDNKISTVSQTVDSISSIVSDPNTGLTKRVQTAEGTLSQVTGTDIPNLQKATYWQPYSSLDFNSYTKQGSYFFNTTSAKTNGPVSGNNSWTYLMVEQGVSDNSRIKQTAWYDGVNGVKITYVRTLNSGTWSPWYANDNDSVTTISQTNSNVRQEIADRKTGDSNTLQSSKDFTQSSITSAVKGVNSTITQTSESLIAKIDTKTDSDTVLSLFKDNYSLGINSDGSLVSGLIGNQKSVTLKGNAITLDGNTKVNGDFYALGGNFKNINASNIVGTNASFFQANFIATYGSNISIDGSRMEATFLGRTTDFNASGVSFKQHVVYNNLTEADETVGGLTTEYYNPQTNANLTINSLKLVLYDQMFTNPVSGKVIGSPDGAIWGGDKISLALAKDLIGGTHDVFSWSNLTAANAEGTSFGFNFYDRINFNQNEIVSGGTANFLMSSTKFGNGYFGGKAVPSISATWSGNTGGGIAFGSDNVIIYAPGKTKIIL
ncbi:hypothetical protein [Leuconostoc falkenbergense]|uniref:hypothetical protein n=1 Tax=Leuconostoc falkenbergense TaxID=2766470 RepID=UPI00166AB30E|nr:hypothetical protein [Leuconostoc falkenbergense]